MKGTSCALTGHRILPSNFDHAELYRELRLLILRGCDNFFCGMAEGFDLVSLSLLLELKEEFPLYLEACVPYRGQETGYSQENKRLYADYIKKCDRVTVLEPHFTKGCYLERDRYMVDCADFVFAYCTRNTGGTAYTVRYAEKTGKQIVNAFSEELRGAEK